MTYYANDLFKNVLKNPSKESNKLIVLSGYSSSYFLKKFIEEFPQHSILLIIGMAPYGITRQNHEEYQKICSDFNNVQVYYNCTVPVNHMKIYQWYNNNTAEISFTGSANFTEAGFFKQKEVLVPLTDDFSPLIKVAQSNSISCLDPYAGEVIHIYDEDENELYTEIQGDFVEHISPEVERRFTNLSKSNEVLVKNKLKRFIRVKNFGDIVNSVSVELILEKDKLWETRGLNIWNRGGKSKKDSYINIERINKNRGIEKDFFPRNQKIKFFTDDGIELLVKREGTYGKQLVIVDDEKDFYSYFAKRIGLQKQVPISRKDLLKYGRTNVSFKKNSQEEYLLDFSV